MRGLLVGFMVVLVACSDGTGVTGARGELAAARAAWSARALESYDFDLRYGGAWFPPITVRIEVRDGLATTARDLAADTLFTVVAGYEAFTVDSLFEVGAHWVTQPGFNVEMAFHRTLWYPTSLYIDNPGWADEEQSFEIVRLVAR